MPELPEVETSCRGITPHITSQKIKAVIIRQAKLRWPIPTDLSQKLIHTTIQNVHRRGKYLLLASKQGTLIIHLGMSGRLHILPAHAPAQKHDHVDIIFDHGKCLRFTDPRRFGAILWTEENPLLHPLLKQLGPEPLTNDFNGLYLFQQIHKRKQSIKLILMNSQIVVGVGNIYANEVLFAAKIHPNIPAGQLNKTQCNKIVKHVKTILEKAIQQGGTTLKDFSDSQGKPGYFKQELQVYGRGNQPCIKCKTLLIETRLGQRTTVFCPMCQK